MRRLFANDGCSFGGEGFAKSALSDDKEGMSGFTGNAGLKKGCEGMRCKGSLCDGSCKDNTQLRNLRGAEVLPAVIGQLPDP